LNGLFFSGLHLKKRNSSQWIATAFALVGLAVLSAFPALVAPHIATSAQKAAFEAQYRLPDGSVPYICFIGAGDPANQDRPANHCPLCTLTQHAGLPSQAPSPAFFLLERRGKPFRIAEVPEASHTSGGLGPRAPPVQA